MHFHINAFLITRATFRDINSNFQCVSFSHPLKLSGKLDFVNSRLGTDTRNFYLKPLGSYLSNVIQREFWVFPFNLRYRFVISKVTTYWIAFKMIFKGLLTVTANICNYEFITSGRRRAST